MNKKSQAGFTIVELMVATSVFSSILLVMTFAVMQFSRSYYRGITASKTQSAARTISEDVSQAIQFSGGDVTMTNGNAANGYKTICIGNKQYDVDPFNQVSDTEHGLWVTPRSGNCLAKPFTVNTSDPSKSSRELLGPGMRAVKFSVTPLANNVYSVSIKIANGDNDLLCSPSQPNDCSNGVNDTIHQSYVAQAPPAGKTDLRCRPITGSQFCSVSELNVSVQKRIN